MGLKKKVLNRVISVNKTNNHGNRGKKKKKKKNKKVQNQTEQVKIKKKKKKKKRFSQISAVRVLPLTVSRSPLHLLGRPPTLHWPLDLLWGSPDSRRVLLLRVLASGLLGCQSY